MTSDNRLRLERRTVLGATGLGVLGALPGAVTGDEHENDEADGGDGGNGGDGGEGDGRSEVMEIISDWEEKQHEESVKTMDEYGVPEGVTERRLIWYDADPWKRIEIFRDATEHEFPAPHPDFFEQFIDYQVPAEKADELTEYDGSIMFERTTGVMSARCHTEWANFLAINLANDIVTDQKSVEEARQMYAETAMQKMEGGSPAYTQEFQFELPEGDQRDPDEAVGEQNGQGGEGDGDGC